MDLFAIGNIINTIYILEDGMAIYTILEAQKDIRHDGEDCTFNGYLEDYLEVGEELDPSLREAFTNICKQDSNVRVIVGLKSVINRDAISNQIIRYKDVFKLNGRVLNFPYILYAARDEQEKALLVVPYSRYGYIYAKGFYYCMTEPGGIMVDNKNDIVAICTDKSEKIVNVFNELFTRKAGALQRAVDREFFTGYEDLKRDAVAASYDLKDDAVRTLSVIEDKTLTIYRYIIQWFLMKKVLYVQYMVNKDILNSVHEGNIKKQRNQAKLNADEISFLSFSEMWRITPETAAEEETAETEE